MKRYYLVLINKKKVKMYFGKLPRAAPLARHVETGSMGLVKTRLSRIINLNKSFKLLHNYFNINHPLLVLILQLSFNVCVTKVSEKPHPPLLSQGSSPCSVLTKHPLPNVCMCSV